MNSSTTATQMLEFVQEYDFGLGEDFIEKYLGSFETSEDGFTGRNEEGEFQSTEGQDYKIRGHRKIWVSLEEPEGWMEG